MSQDLVDTKLTMILVTLLLLELSPLVDFSVIELFIKIFWRGHIHYHNSLMNPWASKMEERFDCLFYFFFFLQLNPSGTKQVTAQYVDHVSTKIHFSLYIVALKKEDFLKGCIKMQGVSLTFTSI